MTKTAVSNQASLSALVLTGWNSAVTRSLWPKPLKAELTCVEWDGATNVEAFVQQANLKAGRPSSLLD